MAQLLDGKACAKAVRQRIRREIEALSLIAGSRPHVVFVQVGEIPASSTYVNAKSAAAERAGLDSSIVRVPEQTSEAELLQRIHELNYDPGVHGILVQLPLPDHIDPLAVAMAISPDKDVDCFNPINVGRVAIGLPAPLPATPQGILMLLDHYGIDVSGMNAVVVGRSNLVGKPLGLLLLARHASVSWCHSRTADLGQQTRRAELLISAAGRAGIIRGNMVMPGAIVVDVGTNYIRAGAEVPIRGQRDKHEGVDPSELQPEEMKLVGDVVFDEVEPVASWISPVPGGVGPMTIASVLQNGLMLWKRLSGLD